MRPGWESMASTGCQSGGRSRSRTHANQAVRASSHPPSSAVTERAGLVWHTHQMGVSPAAGPVPQCRSVPLRATMVHADSQVAPGKAIRMPGLCAICGDLTRVKQLLHAAAACWKQIMGDPQVNDGRSALCYCGAANMLLLVLADSVAATAAAAPLTRLDWARLESTRPTTDDPS